MKGIPKIKPPCYVVDKESGSVLVCRGMDKPNRRMKAEGWEGMVCKDQNHNGTGLARYNQLRLATKEEIEGFSCLVRKTFRV